VSVIPLALPAFSQMSLHKVGRPEHGAGFGGYQQLTGKKIDGM